MYQNKVLPPMPEFISPPVTPKQYFAPQFYEQEQPMIMPPSPPYFSKIHHYQPYYNRRKVSSPRRSLSTYTKGAFSVPILPPILNPTAIAKKNYTAALARNTKLPRVDIASLLNEAPPINKPSIHLEAQYSNTQEKEEETVKKSQTNAAAIFDSLTADSDPEELFKDAREWIPSYEVFNRRPVVRISWKGSPLKIKTMPYFEKLHPGEVTIAATLRLTPEQYLKCKWALVLAAKEAYETNQLFRKSEAQKVCCIDVNKTSVLWHAFGRLGWLGKRWPQ